MSSRIASTPESFEWKRAYLAAVLEKDRRRVPGLIEEAKEKLSERVHELWKSGPVPSDELETLDDALYLLQALLSSVAYGDAMGEWSRSSLDS